MPRCAHRRGIVWYQGGIDGSGGKMVFAAKRLQDYSGPSVWEKGCLLWSNDSR
jgi:hypothetical protein